MTDFDTGIVAIAKNEGQRLARCLASMPPGYPLVYADSASTDGSAGLARRSGVEVVVLDVSQRAPNQPRGRNAGLARLLELWPELRYVFFVDGDCEIVPGFLEAARGQLEGELGLAAVCGRRREIQPQASVYNMLIDTEWNTALGRTASFGGDVVIRASALREVGTYEESMISGEDHELAFRLTSAGWGIRRIAHEMTRHDVAIMRFVPWCRRHARGGYAYAHGHVLNRARRGGFNRWRVINMLAWGALLPLLVLVFLPIEPLASGALCGLYLWPAWRVRAWRIGLGDGQRNATLYGAFIAFGKVAEAWGVLCCFVGLLRRRGFRYVEYKDYQHQRGRSSDAA